MLEVNHATPLYEQLEIAIRNDITNGVYSYGERMPSETELGEHYGVSRITVRRAVQELEEEGMLERKQGKGTFVRHVKVESKMDSIQGFTDSLSGSGHKVSRVIHANQIVPAEEWVAEALHLEKQAPVIQLKRTLYGDGEPMMYDECYYPCARFPGMLEKIDETVSTYHLIKEVYGVAQPRARKCFSVEIADTKISNYLGCAVGDPLFSIFKVTFDDKDQPVHISKTLVLASRSTYVLDVDENHPAPDVHLEMR